MPVHKSRLQDACAPNREDSFFSELGWPDAGGFFMTPETMRLALDVLELLERLRQLRRLGDTLDNWLRAETHWLDPASPPARNGHRQSVGPSASAPQTDATERSR
jgi:hypothetical protein